MIGWYLGWAGLGLLLFGWLSALIKMIRGTDLPPEYCLEKDTVPDPTPGESLSIVVPARNEAPNIERCVRAAFALDWDGPLEVVVVDDRSTDGTGEILARLAADEPRLKVVMGADPPPGWLGKPHALHIGQQHATGDWLLFLDADVAIDPLGAKRLIGRTIAQDGDMASGLGRLEVVTFWERVLQTRMGSVIAGGNPIEKVNDPEKKEALANGQCLLFRRRTYDELGGHEAIKGSVLDDVDFAKLAKAEGVAYRLYFAPGVFGCRMYTTFNEIWNGWTKNLFPALGYSVIATLISVAFIFASSVLPFVLLTKNLIIWQMGGAFSPFIWIELALVLVILATDGIGHAVKGYKWGLFWTFPFGMTIICFIFFNSAWRIKSGKGAVWKGRVVEAGGGGPPPGG